MKHFYYLFALGIWIILNLNLLLVKSKEIYLLNTYYIPTVSCLLVTFLYSKAQCVRYVLKSVYL